MLYKRKVYFLLIIFLATISFLFYRSFQKNLTAVNTCLGSENAFSADKINNIEDLIKLLIETESREEREKIFEENKELLMNSNFPEALTKVYSDTYYNNREKLAAVEKIGLEIAEFTEDKSLLAELLLDFGMKQKVTLILL